MLRRRRPGGPGRRGALGNGILVGLALVGFGAGFAAPAQADFFGKLKMDDARVDFASDEANEDHQLYWNHFVHFQNIKYDNLTVLTMLEQPRFAWNDHTDVVWFAAPFADAGVGGDEVCRKKVGLVNLRCDRARTRFNEALTRRIRDSDAFDIPCHEFGHAFGFEHMPQGCMNKAVVGTNGAISQHMVDHINAQYG